MGRIGWTAGVFAAALAVCTPALAQTPAVTAPPRSLALPPLPGGQQQRPSQATAQQRVAYDAAFQATLDRPSDPDTLTRFAQLAIEMGDIEGAISALERLLLIDGDQPEVKLELGVLYYRLGAADAATMYLEAAKASAGASEETRKRAETFLKAAGR